MIHQLLPDTDPLLHQRLAGVSEGLDRESFSRMMLLNMIHHKGMGLSANQIGLSERAFAAVLGQRLVVCYNPSITVYGASQTPLDEGCLSYPGMTLSITRPSEVTVRYENEAGEVITDFLSGIDAKVFQHELDHLNGVTFVNRT